MAEEFGYDKDLFIDLENEDFDCIICSGVARNPQECLGCGHLFCKSCITSWMQKKNQCPNRCKEEIKSATKAVLRMYKALKLKCSKCDNTISLGDYDDHLQVCGKPKCMFYDTCEKNVSEEYLKENVCSKECLLLKIVKSTQNNKKEQLIQVKQLVDNHYPPQIVNQQVMPVNYTIKNFNMPLQPISPLRQQQQGKFFWDQQKKGSQIQLQQDKKSVFLEEAAYMFRSIIADRPFMSGKHYWEIQADQRTENELKIGVSCSDNFNYNSAFCDYESGFSFYGLGQLRHQSNASGPQYGKRFKKEGVLGVFLNMDKGEISFALNGEYFGVAFRDPILKKGPIYPAVSLLHKAGCKLDSSKDIPNYFK